MKNPIIQCILILCLSLNLIANEEYDFKENANAIIENYSVELIIKNEEEAILKVYIKTQILNKNGEKHAVFFEYYDQFRKLKSFEGKIYNSLNIESEKIKNKNLIDRSLINNFSLYEDNRVKYYQPVQKKYPYYIEYSYEIEYKGTINLPTWQPINSSHLSLKQASLKVTQEKNKLIRYKLIKMNEPEITTNEDEIIYYWEIKNMLARKKEPLKLPYSRTSPTIYIAPYHFSINGYNGIMSSWEEFGKWRYNLIKTQGELPEDAIKDITELIQDVSDKHEKAKRVYEYMQSRTRYVSIQEGIGGWQPIDATTVHNLGYGDCKALSNYTKALLNVAGIKSYYAVIRAGLNETDIILDFPSNQFNHAILCIPFKKDTIWLECTSQTKPFGYIGDFTGNKHALLITEEGGKIAKTTNYNKNDNLQKRKINVALKNDGSAQILINTSYHGFQYENISYYIDKSKEDQKDFLLKTIELNNFNILDFSLNCKKDINPVAYDSIEIGVKNFATASTSRLFFDLNVLNKNNHIPVKLDQRVSPIRFSYPYTDIDSIIFNIPENYTIEFIPKNFKIENEFGNYSVDYLVDNSQIKVTRILSLNKDVYPPESYDDLIVFFEEIEKHDKSKCVLKKDT